MKLHELQPAAGSTRKSKRIGRGHGSGKGKTAGKGMMGQKARSGKPIYRTFEGGQNRLVKRMPFKRGFTNNFGTEYEVVNLGSLVDWPVENEVTPAGLIAARLVRRKGLPIKVLGDGELTTGLVIHAHRFSSSAREKIAAAGGRAVDLEWTVERRSRSHGPNPSMRNAKSE